MTISKKILLINIIISQIILIIAAILLHLFFGESLNHEIFLPKITKSIVITTVVACILLFLIQIVFLKFVSKDRIFDQINLLLMEKFSIAELIIIFFCGAISEEFLFRATIQPKIGIVLGSIVFTLVHFRYLKKIFILFEVFILGLILGVVFHITSSIWVPIFCHFSVNFFTYLLYRLGFCSFE